MSTILSYGLALAGLGLVLGAIIKMFVGNVRYPEARNRLIQMLRADPHRAEAMCRTKTNTFSDAIGAAIKTAATTGSRDPAMLVLATIPAYDAAAMMVLLAIKQHVMVGKMGAALAGGGFVLAVSKGPTPIVLLVIAVLAVGGLIMLVLRKLEMERSLMRARAEVLPEVDRAFVDGRYTFPG